jgi:tetratricopeptide (TPR) repeat protein
MRWRLWFGMIFPLLPLGAGADPTLLPKSVKAQDGPALTPSRLQIVDNDSNDNRSRLKKEREALAKERDEAAKELELGGDSLAGERAKLRLQLAELLKRIEERKLPAHAPPDHSPSPKIPADDHSKPLDPLNQAQSLYKTGNFDAALRAFRLVDSSSLGSEDKAFVQYMTASCLRRLGRNTEAMSIYREVADAKEDAFLAECAIWQLSNLRWRKELQTQLDELRERRKAR